MPKDIYNKFKKVNYHLNNFRQKFVVRVWNLAKRLDPKQIRRETRKHKK